MRRVLWVPPVLTVLCAAGTAPSASVAWRAGSTAHGELVVAADFSSYTFSVGGVPWLTNAA